MRIATLVLTCARCLAVRRSSELGTRVAEDDLFVTGSISDAAKQSSTTAFFTPQQNGYLNAQVTLTLDEDGTADFGWFTLSLNRASLVVKIDYRSSGNSTTIFQSWTMQPSACVHNFY